MKIKLHKLLGVLLTVTVLVSLMVGAAASPVAADELEWSEFDFPEEGADGGYLYDPEIEFLGPIAQAIDGTYYIGAWVDEDGDDVLDDDENILFTSTDARDWDETEYEGGLIIDIACSSLDADILYVVDGYGEIWKSDEAGDDFDPLGDLPAGFGMVTSIDVGYDDNDDPYVFAGTAFGADSDVYILAEEDIPAEWSEYNVDSDHVTGVRAEGSTDVWEVKVSPNFADDVMVMAVIEYGGETFVTTRYGSAEWGADLDGDAELQYNDTSDVNDIYRAQIWLPDDFDSDPDGAEMGYFVGLASTDPNEGDVYEVQGKGSWDLDINGTNSAVNITGIDGVGNVGDAMVVAGGDDPADTEDIPVVFRSDDNGESWDDQKESPTGGIAFMGQALVSVLVEDDYEDSEECLVATVGTDCALSISHDGGDTFDQISLIQLEWEVIAQFDMPPTGTLHNVAMGGPPNTTIASVFRDTGDGFERTWMAKNLAGPVMLPAGGFSSWFIYDIDSESLWRSTDNGSYFKEQRGAPSEAPVASFSPVTDSEQIVGITDAIEKTSNNGSKWTKYDEGLNEAGPIKSITKSPDFDTDETMLCRGDTSGSVYISYDYGESWEEVEDFGADYADGLKFDPGYSDNGVFYAAGDKGGSHVGPMVIERYGLNGDTWEDISPDPVAIAELLDDDDWKGWVSGESQGIAISKDGTLYACNGNLSGIFRCLNPLEEDTDDIEWEPVTKGCDDDYLAVLMATPGGLFATGEVPFGDTAWLYKDTLTGSPAQTSPTDGSSSDRIDTGKVAWDAMDGADEYVVKYDTDPGFSDNPQETTGEIASKVLTGLDGGKTYYWKVRAIKPTLSRWSDVWSFTTALGAPQWNPFVGGVPESPANGATNVSLSPSFAWNAADWATGYAFVLAKDAEFKDVVVSKTGANALTATVYLAEQPLAYSTTYYWKVQAVSKASSSEWATAVFTTMGQAPAPPEPPTPPTPPEPAGTPAYIWVIIGIGALLVIAVIVLIVRTRRVA
jgi:photosystem II stability/assembly factor-like uncharacterized protein